MSKELNYRALKKYCLGLGVDLFGVADIKELKKEFLLSQKVLASLDYAVSIGMRLSESVLAEIETAPTRLYFHHYKTANAFLDQVAFLVSHYIQAKGYRAFPVPASQIVDWEKQTAHLSHKHMAIKAGLGRIGRNNLLVNKKLGSQFRLSTILTSLPLTCDKPVKDVCGICRRCVNVCPGGAIKEKPEDFDHKACFATLKAFQAPRQVEQYICGICVNACKGAKSSAKGGAA